MMMSPETDVRLISAASGPSCACVISLPEVDLTSVLAAWLRGRRTRISPEIDFPVIASTLSDKTICVSPLTVFMPMVFALPFRLMFPLVLFIDAAAADSDR